MNDVQQLEIIDDDDQTFTASLIVMIASTKHLAM